MTTKTTIIRHSYRIPKPYNKPAYYAIKLFRKTNMHLTDAVEVAITSFTSDRSAPDYIPKRDLDPKQLRKHINRWLASD